MEAPRRDGARRGTETNQAPASVAQPSASCKTHDVSLWMPIYVRDVIQATVHLDGLQRGMLFSLMLHYWASGGALSKSDAHLAKLCGVSRPTFAKHKTEVLGPLFTYTVDRGVKIFTAFEYLDVLMAEARKNREKRVVAGSQGGRASRKRWLHSI